VQGSGAGGGVTTGGTTGAGGQQALHVHAGGAGAGAGAGAEHLPHLHLHEQFLLTLQPQLLISKIILLNFNRSYICGLAIYLCSLSYSNR
jgi:hypothetical protein